MSIRGRMRMIALLIGFCSISELSPSFQSTLGGGGKRANELVGYISSQRTIGI